MIDHIQPVWQISIEHLTTDTLKKLNNQELTGAVVYSKDIGEDAPAGFFIVADTQLLGMQSIPEDLKILIAAAIALNAYYLEVDGIFARDTRFPVYLD